MESGWIHPIDAHHIHTHDMILHGREKIRKSARFGLSGEQFHFLNSSHDEPRDDLRPCAPDPFSPGSAVVQLHLVHSTVAENSKSPLKWAQAERGGDVDKGSQKIQPGKETHVALASDAEEAGRRTAGPRGSRSSERSAALSSFYLSNQICGCIMYVQ